MAGWTSVDREWIEWDGSIRVKNTLKADHINVYGKNTGANVDRYFSVFENSLEVLYFGNYFGYTGIVNPNDGGSILFGVATDALAIQAYFLITDDDLLIDGATLQLGSSTSNPQIKLFCNTLGLYGATPVVQYADDTSASSVSAGGSGLTWTFVDDYVMGTVGTTSYNVPQLIDALKLIGIIAM